jgi:hypothetical protein
VFELKRWRREAYPHDLEYESGALAGIPELATRNAVQYMKNIGDQPGGMPSRLHMPPLQVLMSMSYNDFNDYTTEMSKRLEKMWKADAEEAREAQMRYAAESDLQPGMRGSSMRRMKVKRTRSKKRHASTRKHSKKYAYSRKRIHRQKY